MKLWLKIVIIVLVLALVGGGIAGIIKLADSDKLDNKEISSLAFSVGGLDGAGKYKNTDQSIYTKNAFECQGLNCSLAFDNEISYQIYFYDQNNEFVHTTGKLTGAFVKDSVPFFAKYARIVIMPNDDNKVSRLEVTKYAKQLKTTVYREQGFKNYTDNLLDFSSNSKKLSDSTGALVALESVDLSYSYVSDFVNITSYNDGLYYREAPNSEWGSGLKLFLYNESKGFIESNIVSHYSDIMFTSSEGVVYHYLKFNDFPSSVVFIRMNVLSSSENPVLPQFYCR